MKRLIIPLLCCLPLLGLSQSTESGNREQPYPIILSLHFHGFTMPFKDLKSNFRNLGIGIGTEYEYNRRLFQQARIIWYNNRHVGNGLGLYTQLVFRPTIDDHFGEIKGGIGYTYSFRPSTAFGLKNGKWETRGRRGKGMITIPAGISVGTHTSQELALFTSYQLFLLTGYNNSIPVVPNTFFEAGVLIKNSDL